MTRENVWVYMWTLFVMMGPVLVLMVFPVMDVLVIVGPYTHTTWSALLVAVVFVVANKNRS